jgi:hypothetical protein
MNLPPIIMFSFYSFILNEDHAPLTFNGFRPIFPPLLEAQAAETSALKRMAAVKSALKRGQKLAPSKGTTTTTTTTTATTQPVTDPHRSPAANKGITSGCYY